MINCYSLLVGNGVVSVIIWKRIWSKCEKSGLMSLNDNIDRNLRSDSDHNIVDHIYDMGTEVKCE